MHNLAHVTDERALLELWRRFGVTNADSYDHASHDVHWRAMGAPRAPGRGLGMGSLCFWAKEDAPEAYASWQIGQDVRNQSQEDKQMALLHTLQMRFPDLGLRAESFRIADTDDTGVWFEDDGCGVTGIVEAAKGKHWGGTVRVRAPGDAAEKFAGHLLTDVPFQGPLSDLHQDVPTRADAFVFNQPEEHRAVLRSVTPNVDATITMLRPAHTNTCCIVSRPGERDRTITSRKKVDDFRSRVCEALASDRTMQMILLVNNGTININVGGRDNACRSDTELISTLVAANPALRESMRFAPGYKVGNCSGLYECDDAAVWKKVFNIAVEEKLVKLFRELPGLGEVDRRRIESRRGRADMVHLLGGQVQDPDFPSRLEASPDVFALGGGKCLSTAEGGRPVVRAITPGDHVSMTTKWTYSADQAVAARPDLDDFISKVLPVPEERAVALAFFASLLSGRRGEKKALVMTDRREGNNGKSKFMQMMAMFFGDYADAEKGTKLICKGCFDRGRDAHDAGLEPFRAKRLVVAEELKACMLLDEAFLKRITGGSGVSVGGRSFGVAQHFEYLWQAGIVMIFNEGDCPQYDRSDAAFRERLLFIPMRAKFLTKRAPAASDGPWTYAADPSVDSRFDGWMSALADVLVEHYGNAHLVNAPPASMTEWRDDIAAEGNASAAWCEQHLVVTGEKEDYVVLPDLAFESGIRDFAKLARTLYVGVEGVSYLPKTTVGPEKRSRRGVLRGVKFVGQGGGQV